MIDPCTFVIFGATGNLSQKKLMPALYHLELAGRLPPPRAVAMELMRLTRPPPS